MRCRRCGCDRGSVDRGRPLLCGIRRRALWFGRRGIALIFRFVQLSSPTRTGERPLTSGKCPHLRSDPRDARDWEDAMSEYKLRADCKGHEDDVRGAFRRLTEPASRHTRASLMGSQPPRKDLFRARPLIHRPNERNADVDPPPFPTSRMTRQASRYAATMRSPRVRAIRPSGYGARPSAASGSRAAPSAPGTNPSSPRSRTPQPPTPSSPAGATRSSSRGTPPPATPRPRW
jgi:hypothetical protein